MSGFASNIIMSGKVFTPPEIQPVEQEAAGKVGKALGVIAAIVIPFAAPAIFGAIAGSGVLGASLASAAASGGFIGAVTNIVGSAVIGGAMNTIAGGSFAQGALGGGLGAGMGALSRGLSGGANAAGTAKAGLNAVGGTGPVSLAPGVGGAAGSYGVTNAAAGLNAATATAGGTQSTGVMGTIRNMFSGASSVDLNRIGAAVINAAVNGQSMGELDGAVAQARAELEVLRQQDQAAYTQRINAAQQILADADRQDPSWLARVRMADVAGVMNREHDQALRNIAARQGGSLDSGQRKAYERSGRLDIGRAKALAWGQGWGEGVRNQSALRGQGAALLTGPNAQLWEAGTRLSMDEVEQRSRLRASTAGGFASVFNGGDYNPSTSPETTPNQNNQNDEETDGFMAGLRWPNG